MLNKFRLKIENRAFKQVFWIIYQSPKIAAFLELIFWFKFSWHESKNMGVDRRSQTLVPVSSLQFCPLVLGTAVQYAAEQPCAYIILSAAAHPQHNSLFNFCQICFCKMNYDIVKLNETNISARSLFLLDIGLAACAKMQCFLPDSIHRPNSCASRCSLLYTSKISILFCFTERIFLCPNTSYLSWHPRVFQNTAFISTDPLTNPWTTPKLSKLRIPINRTSPWVIAPHNYPPKDPFTKRWCSSHP